MSIIKFLGITGIVQNLSRWNKILEKNKTTRATRYIMARNPPFESKGAKAQREPTMDHHMVQNILGRVFRARGFSVAVEPRIDGVSSLPISPDLLVAKDDEALLVEVKVGKQKDSMVPAEAANEIALAGDLLTRRLETRSWRELVNIDTPRTLRSVLVIVNAEPSPSLLNFAGESNVEILKVSPNDLRSAMQSDQDLKILSDKFFQTIPATRR